MTKIKQHANICKELNNTYSKKNNDYGDSFTYERLTTLTVQGTTNKEIIKTREEL